MVGSLVGEFHEWVQVLEEAGAVLELGDRRVVAQYGVEEFVGDPGEVEGGIVDDRVAEVGSRFGSSWVGRRDSRVGLLEGGRPGGW
jgi:hypothetical protein